MYLIWTWLNPTNLNGHPVHMVKGVCHSCIAASTWIERASECLFIVRGFVCTYLYPVFYLHTVETPKICISICIYLDTSFPISNQGIVYNFPVLSRFCLVRSEIRTIKQSLFHIKVSLVNILFLWYTPFPLLELRFLTPILVLVEFNSTHQTRPDQTRPDQLTSLALNPIFHEPREESLSLSDYYIVVHRMYRRYGHGHGGDEHDSAYFRYGQE